MPNRFILAQTMATTAHNVILDRGIGQQNLIRQYLHNARTELLDIPESQLPVEDLLSVGYACGELNAALEAVTKMDPEAAKHSLELVISMLQLIIEKEVWPYVRD